MVSPARYERAIYGYVEVVARRSARFLLSLQLFSFFG